jgi:large subunit ribosomal protein L13
MKQNNPKNRKWYLIDAKGKILGRLATKIANLLRGKEKPNFVPYRDLGDNVVVINASQIRVTGKKLDQKIYYHHTGYLGGIKQETFKELLARRPEEVIRKAVGGMLPNNRLKKFWLKKLYIYKGQEHPHKEKLEQIDG